jgi:hypothetical protein
MNISTKYARSLHILFLEHRQKKGAETTPDKNAIPDRLNKTISALLSSPQALPIAKSIAESFLHIGADNLELVKGNLPTWNNGVCGEYEECWSIQFNRAKDNHKFHVDLTAVPLSESVDGMKEYSAYRAAALLSRQTDPRNLAYVREIVLFEQPLFASDNWLYEFVFSSEDGEILAENIAVLTVILPRLPKTPVESMGNDEKWANFFACVANGQSCKSLVDALPEIGLAASVVEELGL